MKFCSACSSKVEHKIPDDDNRLRYVCPNCDIIHYENPNIVAGTIPMIGNKVLLCKRAIEPRYGYWTLPAGFMENQETTDEAALRETWEEAEAKVKLEGLFSVINVPQINQVHMFYRARVKDAEEGKAMYGAGSESLEVALYEEKDIPWDELAFPTVKRTLKQFFADREEGSYGVHVSDIFREPRDIPEFVAHLIDS